MYGISCLHKGQSATSKVSISSLTAEYTGYGNSIFFGRLSTIQQIPTTSAPRFFKTSAVSRDDLPVVTTSYVINTFCPGFISKPLLRVITLFSRSVNIPGRPV